MNDQKHATAANQVKQNTTGFNASFIIVVLFHVVKCVIECAVLDADPHFDWDILELTSCIVRSAFKLFVKAWAEW